MFKSRNILNLLMIVGMLVSLSPAALAQAGPPPQLNRPLPQSLQSLKLDAPLTADYDAASLKLGPALVGAQGRQQVVVRLRGEALASMAAAGDSLVAQSFQASQITAQQDAVVSAALALDASASVLARTSKVLNAVILEVDAATLAALAANPAVLSIRPVVNYELDLSETVPYIGATPAIQDLGFRGEDVKVAVLDSGIDYTHVAFGGAGTAAAYTDAYGTTTADARNKTLDGLFPTARVVGGFDFVGEVWPSGALAPDPDPIDCGPSAIPIPCAGSHGTHVADIIGGAMGVAPEVDLYAVKVCSAVSTSCSGVALIQGMEFAVDPNGDGDMSDHVHIVNMSLGANYGVAYDDDLSTAVNAATSLGVLTVAASGNAADKPYVNSTPSAAFSALSVAQTNVPSATQPVMQITAPAAIAGDYLAVFQPWSAPLAAVIEAPIQYGNGAGGNLLGCSAFPAGSLTGKIVLADRGTCSFSVKISNIAAGGGLIGIIGLVAPGDPFQGGFGGGTPTIPGYMISQADAGKIKGQLGVGVTARFDPALDIPLVGHMVGSSSRGPNTGQMFYGNALMYAQLIKPEIGAPGASVSAEAGTGTGTLAFGGTSGATPMVSGAAALLFNAANWGLSAPELKARLMNTADINIMNRPAAFGGDKAPITRIGGGEVRVDRAILSPAAAWELNNRGGALSFGFVDATNATTRLRRTVVVHNYSDKAITYNITPAFRFANDVANGAVNVSAPASIRVPGRSERRFTVTLTIDGTKLREWGLNSGPQGANGDALTTFEYDGYLFLDDPNTATTDDLHLAWQVLPRLSGDVRPSKNSVTLNTTFAGLPAGTVNLRNRGVGTARVDTYSLIGANENLAQNGAGSNQTIVDLRSVGVATFGVPANFCSANPSFVMSFAVNTWYQQSHANAPGLFDILLDTNRDGSFDFDIFNFDASLSNSLSDGRNVAWVDNLKDGLPTVTGFFFTDHGLNSGNTILTVCAEQIGMTLANVGQFMDVAVFATDWYNSGATTDSIEGITIAPGGERYLGLVSDIAPGATETMTVVDFGPAGTNPSETGVLVILDADRSTVATTARGGAPAGNEALLITVNP